MKPADNFNPGQWLVENKLTTQSKLNEAKQVGDIYHFTNEESIYNIIKKGKLKPSPARLEKLGNISFTRDRALHSMGSTSNIRLTIDGDKLSNNYKLIPYAQLSAEIDYDLEDEDDDFDDEENFIPYDKSNSESEVVIPSKKYGGSINILPYIKKIDILAFKYPETKKYKGINNKDNAKDIKKYINKKTTIPVEIHLIKTPPSKEFQNNWEPNKYSNNISRK